MAFLMCYSLQLRKYYHLWCRLVHFHSFKSIEKHYFHYNLTGMTTYPTRTMFLLILGMLSTCQLLSIISNFMFSLLELTLSVEVLPFGLAMAHTVYIHLLNLFLSIENVRTFILLYMWMIYWSLFHSKCARIEGTMFFCLLLFYYGLCFLSLNDLTRHFCFLDHFWIQWIYEYLCHLIYVLRYSSWLFASSKHSVLQSTGSCLLKQD